MKKLSVVLAILLLASLCLVAAPVSAAGPLQWNREYLPSTMNNILAPAGLDIYDFAINGDTVYAVGKTPADTCMVYKSVDGGATWSLNNDATTLLSITHSDMVAVAPDDEDIVVIVDATNMDAYVSTNGGASWSQMGTVPFAAAYDVSISPSDFGKHYVAVAGTTGGVGSISYFDFGAASPTWRNANSTTPPWSGAPGADAAEFYAVGFSPNFASDYIMLAVSGTDTRGVELHAASFNSFNWNEAIGYFQGYPATIATGTDVTVNKASIAISPDYMAGDDVLRTAFVGLTATDTGAGTLHGIYRMSNYVSKQLMSPVAQINSVDYNGTTLVASAYDSNVTYYSVDPLVTTPTVLPSRSYKRIGVDSPGFSDQVIVAWHGDEVVGGKRGDASAFSVSSNNGLTWNDISLIDSVLETIDDIYVAADSVTWYVAARDSDESSFYRYDGTSWARVLCDTDTTYPWLLRGAPDDAAAIYAAQYGGTTIYFSEDSGETRWYNRTAAGLINDLAVESTSVIYFGTGSTVRKSTEGGSVWGPPSYPLTSGNIYTITSLGEDNLIVGGTSGYVGYSTDGAETWTRIPAPVAAGAMNVQVTAGGLADDDFIYAASGSNEKVSRWQIGTSVTFLDISPFDTGSYATGIELAGGILYVLRQDGTVYRNTMLSWTPSPTPFWGSITTGAPSTTTRAPSALKVATGADGNKLYTISVQTVYDLVYSFHDTLAFTGPEPVSPADDSVCPVNPINGVPYAITFTWERPSLATDYLLFIGLDEELTMLLTSPVAVTGGANQMVSAVMSGNLFTLAPDTVYYWAVRTSAPLSSPLSEVRSFTVETSPVIPEATVSIDAPAWVPAGYDFTVPVDISDVQSFNAASYNVSFDPTVIELTGVTAGDINGTTIPVLSWDQDMPGEVEVTHDLAGMSGVNGSGQLAVLHFTATGSIGESTMLDIHDGTLLDSIYTEMPTTWEDDLVYIAFFLMGDANGDGVVNALDITELVRIILELD